MSESEAHDWLEYLCKGGDLLFYYNKITTEHRFPKWDLDLEKWSLGEVIQGGAVNTRVSTSTQTDDTGCCNGCTSIYVDVNRPDQQEQKEMCDLEIWRQIKREIVNIKNADFPQMKVNFEGTGSDNESGSSTELYNTDDDNYPDRTTRLRSTRTTYSTPGNYTSLQSTSDKHDHESNICNLENSNSRDSVKDHKGKKKCRFCGRAFTHINACRIHEKTHEHDKLNANSTEIQSNYTRPDDQNKHSSRMKLEKEKLHKCRICGRAFTHIKACKIHEKMHKHEKLNVNSSMIQSNRKSDDHLLDCDNSKNKQSSDHMKLTNEKHKCRNCGRAFTHVTACRIHETIHAQKNLSTGYVSSTNNENNTTTGRPSGHNRKITKQYKCKYCGQAFTHATTCRNHERNHTDKPFKCRVCTKTFGRKWDVDSHVRLVHSNDRPFPCTFCDKKFKVKQACEIHMRTHTGEKPYNCDYCSKAFTTTGERVVHLRVHTGEKPYKCRYCRKRFSRSSHCKSHELIHSGKKPFKCKECGKEFRHSTGLKTHQYSHSGKKPFKCQICLKTFATGHEIKMHQRVHSGEKPFKCKHCDKTFSNSGHRLRHERIHSGEKPFKCKECDKTFHSSSDCKRHEVIHSGVKAFKCQYCDKTFSLSSNRRQHERIHSGVRPFKCTYCNKKYKTQNHLKLHVRVHTGEKPYKCKFCSNKFSNSSGLKRHEYYHTKPFTCKKCDKAFDRPSRLRKHEETH